MNAKHGSSYNHSDTTLNETDSKKDFVRISTLTNSKLIILIFF
jgi:hypothetical protein